MKISGMAKISNNRGSNPRSAVVTTEGTFTLDGHFEGELTIQLIPCPNPYAGKWMPYATLPSPPDGTRGFARDTSTIVARKPQRYNQHDSDLVECQVVDGRWRTVYGNVDRGTGPSPRGQHTNYE